MPESSRLGLLDEERRNVAMAVARTLALDGRALRRTDMADHAIVGGDRRDRDAVQPACGLGRQGGRRSPGMGIPAVARGECAADAAELTGTHEHDVAAADAGAASRSIPVTVSPSG